MYKKVLVRKIPQNISPKILAWNTISDVKAEFPLFSVRIFCLGLKSFEKPLLKKKHPPSHFPAWNYTGFELRNWCPKFNLDSCLNIHLNSLKKKQNTKAGTAKSLEGNKKTAPRAFNIVKPCETFQRGFLVFTQLSCLQWYYTVH